MLSAKIIINSRCCKRRGRTSILGRRTHESFPGKGDLELNLIEEVKQGNATEIRFMNTMPLLPKDV